MNIKFITCLIASVTFVTCQESLPEGLNHYLKTASSLFAVWCGAHCNHHGTLYRAHIHDDEKYCLDVYDQLRRGLETEFPAFNAKGFLFNSEFCPATLTLQSTQRDSLETTTPVPKIVPHFQFQPTSAVPVHPIVLNTVQATNNGIFKNQNVSNNCQTIQEQDNWSRDIKFAFILSVVLVILIVVDISVMCFLASEKRKLINSSRKSITFIRNILVDETV